MTDPARREAHFDLLFEQLHEPVERYLLRRLPADEVNDAAAEIFLILWRGLDRVPAGLELPWLYATAHNVVRNLARSRRRRAGLSERLAREPAVPEPDPVVLVINDEESTSVLMALARLRPADREILRLRAWEQLPSQEIAAALGISAHAVDVRVSRAVARLAGAYESVGRLRSQGSRPVARKDLP
jgi:RNA polymerase sigma-70 factor (ECF subfamily)